MSNYFSVKVNRPEYSRLLQEKAFELGWFWENKTGESHKNVSMIQEPYLSFVTQSYQHSTEGLLKRGHIYWDNNPEAIDGPLYELPQDFEKVFELLNIFLAVDGHKARFDYERKEINIGCTTIPFSLATEIYLRTQRFPEIKGFYVKLDNQQDCRSLFGAAFAHGWKYSDGSIQDNDFVTDSPYVWFQEVEDKENDREVVLYTDDENDGEGPCYHLPENWIEVLSRLSKVQVAGRDLEFDYENKVVVDGYGRKIPFSLVERIYQEMVYGDQKDEG